MMTSGASGKVLSDHDVIVDHIIPRRLVDDPLDPSNLWCLSRSEHVIKTKVEQDILVQPNKENILKHASEQWWIKAITERTDTHN